MKFRSSFYVLCGIAVGVAEARAQATWQGGGSNLWSNASDWFSFITPTNGATGTVDYNLIGAGTSTIDSNFTLNSITFQNAVPLIVNNSGGATLTLAGTIHIVAFGSNSTVALDVPIVGPANVWLNGGTGMLTLNPGLGANTFTGSTQVYAGGTLADGENNSFSPDSDLFVGGGGTPGTVLVNFNETILDIGDVSGCNGTITIASGKTLFISGNVSNTYTGVINGNGNLEKDGASTQILAGTNSYTGTTVVGIGAALSLGNGGTTGSITSGVSGAGSLIINRSNAYTFSNILSGALNVVQQGSGTTTFSGTNTYSGPTTLNGGTLKAGSTSAFGGATALTQVNINNSAVLDLNNFSNTIGSLESAGATSSVSLGTGTLTIGNIFAGATIFAGTITGAGGSLNMGGNVLDLTNANTYTGGTTISAGTLEADNAGGSATGTGQISIGATATLQIGNGDANGIVSAGAAINDNGVVKFFRSDAATLPNTISGTGGVGMFGFLSETLSGTNAYSGETESFRGILRAGSTSAFGGLGLSPVVFDGIGSTLDLNNFNNTVGSIAGPSGNSITLGTATLTIGNSAGNTTFGGVISGGGSVVFGENSIILTGSNTYAGGTTVTNGTLLVANSSGSATGTGTISLSPGAILAIGAGSTAGAVSAAAITDNGTIDFNRSDVPTVSSVIGGTGSVTLNGGGVVLTGNNTYAGATNINSGTLYIGDGSTVGARVAGSIYDGNALQFAPAGGDNYTYSGVISGPGTVNFAGPGSITLSGTNTYAGITTLTSSTLADAAPGSYSPNSSVSIGSSGALQVNFNEAIGDLENHGGGGGPVTLASGTTLTLGVGNSALAPFLGMISGNGALAINTSLPNSQGLGGTNTYTGGTTVMNGELFVGSNTALGTGTATFDSGTELSPNASVTLANPIVLSGGESLDNDDGGNNGLTLTGLISEVGGTGSITWCTPGTLALTNANTFTGGVDMREGVLLLGNDSAAGTGTITPDTNTVLTAFGTGVTRTVANNINVTGSAAEIGSFDNNFITITGSISGEASLEYAGGTNGTLTLAGANNGFSGPFTIMSGTVVAGNNHAFGSSGNSVYLTGGVGLNVMSGITINNPLFPTNTANVISGSGTIGSAVTVDSTVILSPSASPGGGPGNLTFTSGLTLASGGTIHFDLYDATGAAGTGYSLIAASGGLGLTASPNTLTFNILSTDSGGNAAAAINFNPAISYSWAFAAAPAAITGFTGDQFDIITAGFANGTNGGTFSVADSGNDLTLNFTPAPEPSTWAMIGMGVAAVAPLALRRRKRSVA